MKDDLLQADYRLLVPVIALFTIALMFRAAAWRTLLLDAVPYRDVFFTLNIGYLLNNILPLRLGEVARAFILGRHGLGFWRVLSTILIERAFDFAIIASMLLATLPFVTGTSQAYKFAVLVSVLVVIGFVIFYIIAKYRDRVLGLYENLAERWSILNLIGLARVKSFITGLEALTDVRRFLKVLLLMILNWGFAVFAQYLLLLAFFPSAKFIWILFGQSVVALGVALPSAPAYIGLLEAAWIGAFTLVGINASTAFAFAVTSHLIHISVTGVFGIYGLVREGESLFQLYSQMRTKSS